MRSYGCSLPPESPRHTQVGTGQREEHTDHSNVHSNEHSDEHRFAGRKSEFLLFRSTRTHTIESSEQNATAHRAHRVCEKQPEPYGRISSAIPLAGSGGDGSTVLRG